MQSQIREVMNRSTSTLGAPPGHGAVEYASSQHADSHSQTYQYGGQNGSMVNDEKSLRPSALKNFSSRFSTTSYMGAYPQKEMTDEQRLKREEHDVEVSNMTWLDRQRKNKRFALYTFLGLNGLMMLVILLTAVTWISMKLIKKHTTTGIPVTSSTQTVSN